MKTFYKQVIGGVVGLLLLVGFWHPYKALPTTAPLDRFEQIKQTNNLRCGYIDYPPYVHKDPVSGKITGISVDLMDAISRVTDLKIEWAYETTWGTALTDLNAGRFDAVCSQFWLSAHRAREALPTKSLGYEPLSRWEGRGARGSNKAVREVAAIDGTIESGIFHRDYAAEDILELPNTTSYAELLLSVAQGKAKATLVSDYLAEQFNEKNPDQPLIKNTNVPTLYIPSVFFVSPTTPRLVAVLNAAIDEITYNGAAQKVWATYNPQGTVVYRLRQP